MENSSPIILQLSVGKCNLIRFLFAIYLLIKFSKLSISTKLFCTITQEYNKKQTSEYIAYIIVRNFFAINYLALRHSTEKFLKGEIFKGKISAW